MSEFYSSENYYSKQFSDVTRSKRRVMVPQGSTAKRSCVLRERLTEPDP